MSIAPFLALGLLAAALVGSIAWQLAPPNQDVPLAAPAQDRTAPASTAGTPSRIADPAAIALARPLFSPERRPPAPGAAPLATADAPLPRLTGILVTSEGRSAMFAGSPQPVLVREGGVLGRYTVRSIEPGLVTLHGPDGPRILRPSFDPARPSQATATTNAPPTRPRLDESLPPPPGPSPAPPEGPKDAMPFDQNPTPSGQDILRDQARRTPAASRAP